MHSERLLDHFQNPRNIGTLDGTPGAVTVEVTNPACGDILRLSALVDNGVIREIRYKTRGCTAAIAAGSALTELLHGRTLAEAAAVKASQVEESVGGLEPASKHAAALCADGVKALLRQFS
jgi:nitrogen fixation NifU-like protein